jgi:hypothetical protein
MTTDNLAVIWRRDARGIVQSFEIHRGDKLLLDTAASDNPDDTLDDLKAGALEAAVTGLPANAATQICRVLWTTP